MNLNSKFYACIAYWRIFDSVLFSRHCLIEFEYKYSQNISFSLVITVSFVFNILLDYKSSTETSRQEFLLMISTASQDWKNGKIVTTIPKNVTEDTVWGNECWPHKLSEWTNQNYFDFNNGLYSSMHTVHNSSIVITLGTIHYNI